jgi:hypothetical protein
MKIGNKSQYQNVKFADQHDPYMYQVKSRVDPTRTMQDSDDAMLENFFSRPIKIFSSQWDVGATYFEQFNPWSLYLNNPRVSNRIANFKLLRGKLKLKFVINGSGFQYGRLIASYLPLATADALSENRDIVPQDLVQASQQPHVFLDPTMSTGGEMECPFFWYKNYISIPQAEWGALGETTIRSFSTLKHANGAADRATISVFAWMEDVSLNMLTSQEPSTLTPQSGVKSEVDTANMNGVVSAPATAIAKAAGALKSVPEIAPFALATEAGATMVAKIAKSMGYSRPPVTKDPEPFKPLSISSLATTTTPDGAQKLTIDDKQELTIDPTISGIGPCDPLNIQEIAKRETYLTQFTWTQGEAPETFLWNARVDPVQWLERPGLRTEYHLTASAMAALPFRYWTGTMKFRFQVVCSSFHKGRIKVVYDPDFISGTEYNTNYMEVIDIADKQDFTIEVGIAQDEQLLEHSLPGVDAVGNVHTGLSAFTSKGKGNGVLGVYVVNELTTPNSTVNNDIQVNVFVSMGDDFEVFVPDDHFQYFVYKPQSGEKETIIPEGHNTDEMNAPQQEDSEVLGNGTTDNGLINKVFIGEAISSFRPLLKRYNLHSTLTETLGTSPIVLFGRRNMFPYLRGNVQGAVNTSVSGPYNYCNTVMLHWVVAGYSGWRGSIRWKIIPRGVLTPGEKPMIQVQRAPSSTTEYWQDRAVPYSPTAHNDATIESVLDRNYIIGQPDLPSYPRSFTGTQGMALYNGYVNPVAEFECPYYEAARFVPGKTENFTGQPSGLEEKWDYLIHCNGGTDTIFEAYCAAGEDFQTYFFTGMPPIWYEPSPPGVPP